MHHHLTRSLLAASAVVLVLAACGGSDDPYWTTSTSASSSGLSTPGTATAMADERGVALRGGDSSRATDCAKGQYGFSDSPCEVTAKLENTDGSQRYNWTYTTTDASGPGADILGVIVDGTRQALSDPGGPLQQSGTIELSGPAEFFVNCTDCTGGAASATINRAGS